MTKAEIVTEIARKTGIERKDVLSTIEAFMEVVKESLTNEENVYLRGFGSFIVKKYWKEQGIPVEVWLNN